MKISPQVLFSRAFGALLLGILLGGVGMLRAELIVVTGRAYNFEGGVYRYDDSTASPRGEFRAMNEGWYGLCRGLTGGGYIIGNTIGRGDLYGIDPDGNLSRGPLWIGAFTPGRIAFGPDGLFYGGQDYVGDDGSGLKGGSARIIRFDWTTGSLLGTFAVASEGGATWLGKFAFGPDRNLYATSDLGILRFRGDTGAFMNVFVSLGSGGLADPSALIFGPDGDLYVASRSGNAVKRFHGTNGTFLGNFIAAGTGGLSQPADLAYGPDGRLYVASYGSHQVLRFNETNGAFLNAFVTTSQGPRMITFTRASGAGETIWSDDALPPGAVGYATGGDAWNWVSGPSAAGWDDGPVYGTKAHRSVSVTGPGVHEHFFNFAQPLPIEVGDTLFAYIYVAGNEPWEIMLSWCDGSGWEHRAFWGYNIINAGTTGTASRRDMGRWSTSTFDGRWVRLEIPASFVGLEGRSISGMSFSLVGGSATWDRVGKIKAAPILPPTDGHTTVWFDDAFPVEAATGTTGPGAWTWFGGPPVPVSGGKVLQSTAAPGLHESYFNWAWQHPLTLEVGDKFFINVYLDPAQLPREIVLSFCAGNWEHRAYWGENLLSYAADGTSAQHRVGALPAAGQWVRLEVPATDVGLAGQAVQGMSLTLYDGGATFDQAGKITP